MELSTAGFRALQPDEPFLFKLQSAEAGGAAYRWPTLRPSAPEPPTGIGDSEWAGQVNAWLDSVATRLLQRIQALVQADRLENDLAFENESALDLYQRVDLRLACLDRLIEHL